jgi:hypothetical protein
MHNLLSFQWRTRQRFVHKKAEEQQERDFHEAIGH